MQLQARVQTLVDTVWVGEAACILGVSTKTLRNWDLMGKLKARRHPINGYRFYLRNEIEDLLNQKSESSPGGLQK